MMSSPVVSVIMPVYNAQAHLEKAILSVVDQHFEDWELIIINDGSTDASLPIAQTWADQEPRIKLITGDNQGVAGARNEGIRSAKGKYIAFLDADDKWRPEKLDKQIRFLEANNLKLTYSACELIDEQDNVVKTFMPPGRITYRDMLKSNWIGNLTGIYDVEYFGKKYMEEVGHEDYVLYLDLMKQVQETQGLTDFLAYYRVGNGSLSSNKFRTIKWQWHIYRKYAKLNLVQSLFYMAFYAFYGFTKYKSPR